MADGSRASAVVDFSDPTEVEVQDASLFAVGDVVVVVVPRLVELTDITIIEHEACAQRITGITDGATDVIEFAQTAAGAPYNTATNVHCDAVRGIGASVPMTVHTLGARAYRIDPLRPQISILQMSPSGGLEAGDWIDLAAGVTDLADRDEVFWRTATWWMPMATATLNATGIPPRINRFPTPPRSGQLTASPSF